MENSKVRQVISVIFILGLSGLLVHFLFLKQEPGMPIVIEADDVAGLEPDNMVTTQGLRVGVVKSMRLKNDYSGKVIINILLTNENLKIPKDKVVAMITDADLMGTKQVNLVYKDNDCTDCLSDYDTIYSDLGSYFDTEINELEPLMTLIEQTYETLDTAVKSWRNENLGDYDAKTRQAERDIKEMMKNFTAAGKATTELIDKATVSYERMSEDAAIVMASAKEETIKEIQSNVAEIQNNLETADFEKTQENIKATLEKWNATYSEIEQTQKLFAIISTQLEKGQTGSLAQILNDPRFQSEDDNTGVIELDYSKLLKDIRNNPEKYTYLFYKEKE